MKPQRATVNKLRKLQAYILEEPRRFHMDVWGQSTKDIKALKKLAKKNNFMAETQDGELTHVRRLCEQSPPCGTVGCLAGSACVVGKLIKPSFEGDTEVYEFPDDEVAELAGTWLGISEYDAGALFRLHDHWSFQSCWSGEWTNKYREAKTPLARAKVACARIDHYIETGK